MTRLYQGLTPYFILTLLCLALFLPGLAAVPPIDRDEARFAQASRQMLESGDFVRINFQGESRAKKPVGIYWMQAASARLLNAESAIWAYRLPSLLGGMAAVLLTFHFGRHLLGRPAALMGSALLAATLILVTEAHQAKTDAVLLAAVVAAQGPLGRLYLTRRLGQGEILLFWLAQGLGILIKGPIVPLISLLTIATLWVADRRIGWIIAIRPMAGLLVVAAMVGPWLAAVSSATQGQFLGQAVKGDLLPKLLGSQESHGAPPGYFLVLATVTLWPLAAFALPGVVRAIKARQSPSLRFLLAWIIPAWLLFEAVPTKLPHYILPTVPALALLAGIAIAADDGVLRTVWAKAGFLLSGVVGLALAAAAIAAPLRFGQGFAWNSLPAATGAVLAGGSMTVLAWRGRFAAAAAAAALGGVLAFGGIFQAVLPDLDRLWLSSRVVAALPPGTPLAAVGFHEPSLVFLAGTGTVLNDAAVAADTLRKTPGSVAVVEAESLAQFQTAVRATGQSPRLIATIEGFNYTRGRPASLSLWGD